MSAAPGVDASPLYRRRVFRSTNPQEARAVHGRWIADHELRIGQGKVDASLCALPLRSVRMLLIRYGPEAEILSPAFEDFSLIQIPLSGSADIVCDGQALSLGSGQSALLSPRHALRVRWSPGSEQLLLRVPHGLLRATASDTGLGPDAASGAPPWPAPLAVIDRVDGARWRPIVQSLIALGPSTEGARGAHPAWERHCETGLALFLLTLASEQAGADLAAPCGHGGVLKAAGRYIQANLASPIALGDVAQAAGVSERTLHTHVTRAFGVRPMAWLRLQRLDAARAQLRRGDAHSIAEVALRCGFGHLGRFSAYYQRRFGELPSETQASP
ncbi:AraC family transcriptional regulator [Variovorax sp. NFACC27]|uniref:AraC family transcriptional regulator n=1 Tax=unclassified Variovorax TaxID=663243 RepID=UPI003AAD0551